MGIVIQTEFVIAIFTRSLFESLEKEFRKTRFSNRKFMLLLPLFNVFFRNRMGKCINSTVIIVVFLFVEITVYCILLNPVFLNV